MARAVSIALAIALTIGCALHKPPDAKTIKEQALPDVQPPNQWTAAAAAERVSDNWLATFGDDRLTAAVAEAIAHNADLRAGAAHVEQARLYAKLAGATLYPSVDLVAHGGGKMGGDSAGVRGIGVSMTWELDVWGRVRYGRAAAVADALAARADFDYARQSIAALVAKSWFLTTEAALQADVARGTIRDGEELVRLAEARSRIGAGSEEDVFVARASVGAYRDALREIELAGDQGRRALELLLGRYPAGAAASAPQLPAQVPAIPAGLPSELLERRPDVVAAERRVAAAFNRVHEAKAARLPSIALTSGIRTITSDLFVLANSANPVWSLGATLLAPIYKGGALQTQVEIRTAEQKEAIAQYASTGLRAFGEVEQALASEVAAREREQILAQTLSDNRRALDLVQRRYEIGSTDLRFVTQQRLAVNATSSALIRMQAEQRVQRVNVHLAVGGSFERSP